MIKEKPKLLIASDNFMPRVDGIAVFLKKIIPPLLNDFDVTVVAPGFGKFQADGFKLVQIPLSNKRMGDYTAAVLDSKKIKKLVSASDVVFSQTIGPVGGLAVIHAKRHRVPCVSFMHSIEWELVPMAAKMIWLRKILYPFMKLYSKYIYNKTNVMIMPSEGILDKVSWHRIRAHKEVVNLGVDTEFFKPYDLFSKEEKEKIDAIRKELGLENSFVIGTHGRLAREKDLFTLLRAYSWLVKKNKDVRLLIIGDGLKEIKEKLESVPGVIVLSARSDVNIYLNLFDVYVTASLTETTSLSTLEAMSTGLSVVSTPVGFIKEYIKDNFNGFFFSKRNEFALYKKLELLKNNRSFSATIGKRAREMVVDRFSWAETERKIRKILKDQV